ncbi:hypothetical protein KUCAC02_001187 [Chaenocephalus aceratus]|uniref:Uncharacterized protein n=1 Tax=Chaenocephalus aceratus TaxID=36190 RepID=A0ACB9XXE1_CHAAC|nr:hypothetical protein KUCAC02_001187 [Chaenocephalus aceratus]
MAQVKTRATSTSHLSNLVGTGRELLVSEPPTVRDILRYGIYLRDQSKDDRRNYPADQLVGDTFLGLIGQWSKANALFKPPVINEKVTIMSKLKEVWNQAVTCSLGKGRLDAKERFSVKLDPLFDMLTCKCQISSCERGGCDGCVIQDNINCSCSGEKRIPLKDITYIKGQKEKVGSKGPHQMGAPNLQEHKRQVGTLERQGMEKEERRRSKEETRQPGRMLRDVWQIVMRIWNWGVVLKMSLSLKLSSSLKLSLSLQLQQKYRKTMMIFQILRL